MLDKISPMQSIYGINLQNFAGDPSNDNNNLDPLIYLRGPKIELYGYTLTAHRRLRVIGYMRKLIYIEVRILRDSTLYLGSCEQIVGKPGEYKRKIRAAVVIVIAVKVLSGHVKPLWWVLVICPTQIQISIRFDRSTRQSNIYFFFVLFHSFIFIWLKFRNKIRMESDIILAYSTQLCVVNATLYTQ